MSPTRVLIVEDSVTIRMRLRDVLEADADIEVVGLAENGKRAIELCEALRPDVITMDMMLPVMSGLAATEYIMAHCPTPILVVSASMNRGELFKTYEALSAGAVDVLEKPNGKDPHGNWEHELRSSVKLVARIRVITHLRSRLGGSGRTDLHTTTTHPVAPLSTSTEYDVVAIGASTGGPAAIVQVLRDLPRDFPLPLLVVIHISEPFGRMFAEWLDGQTNRRVAYAHDGQPLHEARGRVVMAPPDHHLTVRNGVLHLDSGPPRHSCRPSVDVLFESIAKEYGSRAGACLLTGMGTDGAAGLRAIHEGGGVTLAQDEATSVVYGMPREAALLGAAQHILGIDSIGRTLARLTHSADGEVHQA